MSFNYAIWETNTTATLANVPWSADYRDIVNFASRAQLDAYIDANAGPSFSHMTRARVNEPVKINVPFEEAYNYNYVRLTNGGQPVLGTSPDTFYYFIHDVRYIAPNTTELVIQLDVWQSFGHLVEFGNCFIERGHIGIANSNQMINNGRNYLTVPEGLDLGGEYNIQSTYRATIATGPTGILPYDIIVATTVSIEGSGGTIEDPSLSSSKGSQFEGLPNGVEFYLFNTLNEFTTFMAAIADKPWISQGIISVMAVPDLLGELETSVTIVPGGVEAKKILNTKVSPRTVKIGSNFRDSIALSTRYQHLKKFLTYPYTVVEMTTYSGNPLLLKPESMSGDDVDVVMLMHLALPNPRLTIYPLHYNGYSTNTPEYQNGEIYSDNDEFLDMVTGIFDFPTFSIVNNGYMSFMASNARTLPYQQQSAEWSQQRALGGNQLSFDQSSAAMSLSQDLTGQGINAATQTTALNNATAGARAIQSGANALIGGVGGGPAGLVSGVMGAANSAAGYAITANQNNQQLGISNALAQGQNRSQVENQGYVRDTNKAYADFAARGDYQNTIAAINARVQDARMLQPSTSGQMSGDAFNLAMYEWALHAKVKTIQQSARALIGEYWLRYGYQINRFASLPSNLHVMQKFTYWKLRETYLTSSSCPESFKLAIRGIFEKGVTVWVNPSDIGNIDIADNLPLEGITL